MACASLIKPCKLFANLRAFVCPKRLSDLLLFLPLMTIGHKAGQTCHFRVLHNVSNDTGRKKKKKDNNKKEKSFGIYWEGDDTFDLKVPRVGDRTASGGSSFQSLTMWGNKVLLL